MVQDCERGPKTGGSAAQKSADAIELLGQPILAASQANAIAYLIGRLRSGGTTRVAFFNSHLANSLERCGGLRQHLRDFVVLNDGLATDMAGLLVRRRCFPSNLNGTDLTPALLDALPQGSRVFLYGSSRHVVERYAMLVREAHGLSVCGVYDGYQSRPADVRHAAVAAAPDVVLVALGNPLQELWIASYPDTDRGTLLLGVGALFDFATAEKKRAPVAMRRMRAEWLYRLVREPRRLGRRYTLGIVEFFWRVWRHARSPVKVCN